jgi:hypothetical protein
MVAIGTSGSDLQVIDRRRIELIEDGELWARMPYHAAEELEPDEAGRLIERGIESAYRVAAARVQDAIDRLRGHKYEIAGCGVLVPSPMPDWSAGDILAVHFRMHKAEGVLFPDALCRAAEACNVPLAAVPEKTLEEYAAQALGMPPEGPSKMIAELGKPVGPPWAKDQRNAALAAVIALKNLTGWTG